MAFNQKMINNMGKMYGHEKNSLIEFINVFCCGRGRRYYIQLFAIRFVFWSSSGWLEASATQNAAVLCHDWGSEVEQKVTYDVSQ